MVQSLNSLDPLAQVVLRQVFEVCLDTVRALISYLYPCFSVVNKLDYFQLITLRLLQAYFIYWPLKSILFLRMWLGLTWYSLHATHSRQQFPRWTRKSVGIILRDKRCYMTKYVCGILDYKWFEGWEWSFPIQCINTSIGVKYLWKV